MFVCVCMSPLNVCETAHAYLAARAQNTVPVHAGVLLGRLGRFQVPVRVLRGLPGGRRVGARRLRQGDGNDDECCVYPP